MQYELCRYGSIEIGDRTLSERFAKALQQLGSNPEASVRKACGDPGQSKAVYRLVGNEKFTIEAIDKVQHEKTVERIKESGETVILMPQDTTVLNYTNLEEAQGLGPIGSNHQSKGILLHSALALQTNGKPLGIASQKIWVRTPEGEVERSASQKRERNRERSIEEKESYCWLETMERAEEGLTEKQTIIHICDREGDIYEFYEKASQEGRKFLVRRVQNRKIQDEEEKFLQGFLDKQPVAGEMKVHIPYDSHTKRRKRDAQLEIRYGKVTILRPSGGKDTDKLEKAVTVQVMSAQEINVPEDAEGISWQLITNLDVQDVETARMYIGWYSKRWMIETFHYTLKSGCTVEKLQYDSASKLMKLIGMYSIIAALIMWITYLARTDPEASCESEFTPREWKMLYCVAKKTKKPPEKPPTIFQVVILIAMLGGFSGYKSSGFPGVKSIWWGWTKFDAILQASEFIANFVG